MVQEKHRGKQTTENKEVHKVKLFPCISPDLITAPQWLLVQHFAFGVRRAFKFLSYSQHSVFLKYSSLFCCLGCSPPGTLLVVGVGRGLFFLCFGLVKRIKITSARLSFTTAVKTGFNWAVPDSESWESLLCCCVWANKISIDPNKSGSDDVTVWRWE